MVDRPGHSPVRSLGSKGLSPKLYIMNLYYSKVWWECEAIGRVAPNDEFIDKQTRANFPILFHYRGTTFISTSTACVTDVQGWHQVARDRRQLNVSPCQPPCPKFDATPSDLTYLPHMPPRFFLLTINCSQLHQSSDQERKVSIYSADNILDTNLCIIKGLQSLTSASENPHPRWLGMTLVSERHPSVPHNPSSRRVPASVITVHNIPLDLTAVR